MVGANSTSRAFGQRLANVCFGSLADIAAALPNVRFTPEKRTSLNRSRHVR
jgi:hypothetical protein